MGMPAARIGDMHICPMVTGIVPHVGGPVATGLPMVLIGGMPAARIGDICTCVGPPDVIAQGSLGVLIGGMPAARIGDMTVHGGVIVAGLPAVLVGDMGSGAAARLALLLEGVGSLDALINSVKDLAEEAMDKALGNPPPAVTTGLGYRVDKLISKSPKLVDNMQKLKGKTDIEYGKPGGGTFYDPDALPRPKIVVDPRDADSPESVVQSVAHESGHALYTEEPYVPLTPGMTKDEYVNQNTNRHLKDEGEATMTNAEVRKEILDNGGPDIGIAGSQAEDYAKIAEKYPDPADRDKARQEIGDLFADGEQPSGDENAGKSYRDYYGETYKEHYDEQNPPNPPGP